jgi:translation elongation factor EF-1beta
MSDEYNVIANFKVYVENPSKIQEVKDKIGSMAKVYKFVEEDVGFGIKVLRSFLMFKDSEGGIDQMEEKLRSIDGVSETQLEDVSRI